VITGVSWSEELGQEVANVKLSDEKVKLAVPYSEVLQYVLDQPGEPLMTGLQGKGKRGEVTESKIQEKGKRGGGCDRIQNFARCPELKVTSCR